MHDKDHTPFEKYDRREPPAPPRSVVFNEADRVLAVAILSEMERKMGMKFEEVRERDKVFDEIMPTLRAIHNAAKWRVELYRWWLGMAGKMILTVATMFFGFAILYGTVPAFHAVINGLLSISP